MIDCQVPSKKINFLFGSTQFNINILKFYNTFSSYKLL